MTDNRSENLVSLTPDVYQENVDFWNRAWGMVKTPYTQMPTLSYLASIPEGLSRHGVSRVLDLGCGSGWLSIYLARQGFSVTGIDIAQQAISLARAWNEKEGFEIQFDQGDIVDLPYAAHSFDAVVANSIFEHLTYELADDTLKALKRILVPGGVFFGCFDKVGIGPGEFYRLKDDTHVYTDKGRRGMMLRYHSDDELTNLFSDWTLESMQSTESGSRVVWARSDLHQ